VTAIGAVGPPPHRSDAQKAPAASDVAETAAERW
jgi:hypothetical protein